MAEKNELRRYTNILSVMDMLRHKRLTLVSPSTWADQNDSHYLELYRQRLGAESVVAFCLADAEETYHHWQVFAGHPHGACVVFKRDEFIQHVTSQPRLVCGYVRYCYARQVERMRPLPVDALPFLKRRVFEDEREYRVLATETPPFGSITMNVPVPLRLIDRIIFSPLAARPLVETAKEVMSSFDGCEHLAFAHSRLTNNLRWRRAAQNASAEDDL